MTTNDLHKLNHHFKSLKRDMKNGGAPHKPILLLSILQLIDRKEIRSRYIEVSPELVFEFKTIWSKLVETNHQSHAYLPFYHLKSEPFWKLLPKYDIKLSGIRIKSLTALREIFEFAEFDANYFPLLLDKTNREFLKDVLLSTYFPSTKDNYKSIDLIQDNNYDIIFEDEQTHKEKLEELRSKMDKIQFEEEVFVRSGIFKRELPKLYSYQCAISGLQISALTSVQMVDACHIVPFSISRNDTVKNGFCLTPTLHRAFDRGLITITDNYTVKTSPLIKENQSVYAIKQFDGKQIFLPNKKEYYPDLSHFKWHEKEKFLV